MILHWSNEIRLPKYNKTKREDVILEKIIIDAFESTNSAKDRVDNIELLKFTEKIFKKPVSAVKKLKI